MEEGVRLGALQKFVPFLDYILSLEYKYKLQFERLRQWIVDNKKKFAKEFFDKIEKSIYVTYRELSRREDFPKDLHKVFTVDLCSDDEEEKTVGNNVSPQKQHSPPNEAVNKSTKKQTETVTISDNEKDDDIEIISTSSSISKKTDQHRDPNEEILDRINATNMLSVTPREHTLDEHVADNNVPEDNAIFKRREHFNENSYNNNNSNIIENTISGNCLYSAEGPKPKKKKKKHKGKHQRHGKKKSPKKAFIVVDSIVLDSSTDDEGSNDAQHVKFSNLEEPELLEMKSRIISEIETEMHSDAKEKENQAAKPNLPETQNSSESSSLNESELLQIKDKLMKQIGLDQSTSELLKDLNLSAFEDKPLEPMREADYNSNQTLDTVSALPPTVKSTPFNEPRRLIPVIENSTVRHLLQTPPTINNATQHIPTIQNHYRPIRLPNTYPHNQFNNQLGGVNQYTPHMIPPFIGDTSTFNIPPLPVGPPPPPPSVHANPNLLNCQLTVPPFQHLMNVLPVQPTLPTGLHCAVSTPQHSMINQSQPTPRQHSIYNNQNVFQPQNASASRVSSNLINIPHTYNNISTPAPLHTSSNLAVMRPPNVTMPQPNLEPCTVIPIPMESIVPQAETTPGTAVMPTNALNAHPCLNSTNPQLASKDPRLRKLIEEGQYGHNRQPLTTTTPTQTQNANLLPSPQANTTIHNWTRSRDESCESGSTKSTQNYGDYLRDVKRKRQLEEENKRRIEEEKPREEQRKLEEKRKQEEAAKKIEDIELEKQTENIKRILKPHMGDIVDMLEDSDSKQKNKHKESNSKSITSRRKSHSVINRELKELECTVKGFSTIQDLMLTTCNGRRRSSLCARRAIASMLAITSEAASDSTSSENTHKRRSPTALPDAESSSPKRRKANNDLEHVKTKDSTKIKPVRVRLRRLTPSDIAKYMQKPKEVETMALKINRKISVLETVLPKKTNEDQKKPKEKMYATKSVSGPIDIKNIDCRMTERNCDTCVLCKACLPNLTCHFVRYHKTESYVSRLTWEELDDLLFKAPFAEEVQPSENDNLESLNSAKLYKVQCLFCPEGRNEIRATFSNLRLHFSTHTGEYSYQCKSCGIQKPYRKWILDHQEHTKCYNSGLQILYQYPQHLLAIYLYICDICNFVQLNKENIFKHLREQHGKININDKLVKECSLVAIRDEPVERIRLNTTLENMTSGRNCNENVCSEQTRGENYVVGNEAVLDESSTSDVKSEIMFDEEEFLWEIPKKVPVISKVSLCENVVESLQTAALDIKPEIDVLEQNILENPEVPPATDDHSKSITIQEPVLENKPDPEKLTTEAVKALLRKYSANSGIRPDLLYQCSNVDCRGFFSNFKFWSTHMTSRHHAIVTTCPHCVSKRVTNTEVEQPIADFEQHFKTHCLRLYLCFHCDTRCVDEQQLREHAECAHAEITEVRIERIPFNFTYAYHVLVGKDTLPVRLDFLIELCNILRERVQRMETEAEDSEYVASQWLVPNSAVWLDELSLPIFSTSAANAQCILPQCKMSFSSPAILLDHLRTQHDNHKSYLFSCRLCGISSPSKTLVTLVKHNYMHSENIFVCCVCSYTSYDRRLLSKHICSEHDKRDVPVLGIKRSKYDVKVEVGIVFASGSKTFTTTTRCFCGCAANDLRVDTCVSHLRREHQLKLLYFCEHCDERLPHLQQSDEHFHMKHAEPGTVLKVRCQLACSKDRKVNVISSRPLQIRLSDESYESCQNDSDSPKKYFVVPKPIIKKEVGIEEEDDAIIMEEDEVVAENEAKEISKNLVSVRSDISCASISKLF